MTSIAKRKQEMSIELQNQQSLIDLYHLGEDVLAMKRRGMSTLRIANMLNSEYKDLLNKDVITASNVQAWVRKNIDEYKNADKQREVLNTYNEQQKLLNIVDKQIDVTSVFIDEFESLLSSGEDLENIYKRLRTATQDLEKYIARKQSILTQMQSIQDKIYSVQVLSEINQSILQTLKEENIDVYNRVIEKMKVNPILLEAYEKAKDIHRDPV